MIKNLRYTSHTQWLVKILLITALLMLGYKSLTITQNITQNMVENVTEQNRIQHANSDFPKDGISSQTAPLYKYFYHYAKPIQAPLKSNGVDTIAPSQKLAQTNTGSI